MIAVVILNWNGADMMRRFLPSVLNYSPEASVYVGDNGSTDESVEMLQNEFPVVHVIRLDRNYGFAEGYNKTLAAIKADIYVLLNSDVEVTPGWLAPMVSFLREHPGVAACQPKMLALNNPGSFEYAGACGGFVDRYGYPFCRGRMFSTVETDEGQYDEPAEVLWASGACLVIRAEDYWRAGGLDRRFFAHNEEIDLCWRLWLEGRKIYCLPQSRIYHLGGGTLPQGNPKKIFLNFRNNLTMLYKNLDDSELKHVMRARRLLDYIAAVQSVIANHNFAEFKAIIRARKAFNKWKAEFTADRERIQSNKQPLPDNVRKPFSVLWQYYGKRNRHFSLLPHC